METKRTARAPYLAVVLLALPILYVTSYFALLLGTQRRLVDPYQTVLPRYRLEGEAVEQVFYPVHWLDRQVRVSCWQRDEGILQPIEGGGPIEIDDPDFEVPAPDSPPPECG